MSRRIVQIAAVTVETDADVVGTELFALDQNGVAWLMVDPGASKTWVRLPELPSIAARGPVPAEPSLAEMVERINAANYPAEVAP